MGPIKKERRYVLCGIEIGGKVVEHKGDNVVEEYRGLGKIIDDHKKMEGALKKLGMRTYTQSKWA